MSDLAAEISRRRTFAIISHPDAGKTTLTEKLLLYAGAIHIAGSVKSRKASCYATSDWMEIEKQRGISVASSVMQMEYRDCVINLLDTPGHKDFSEDTYRVLTAVDAAVMVIDAANGVEDQTIKLLEVCRLRNTPIITFVNKLDREVRDPIELLDEIESVLKIHCAPITWPIGMGKRFQGVYHLLNDEVLRFTPGEEKAGEVETLKGGEIDKLAETCPMEMARMRDETELVVGAGASFDLEAFLAGIQTPVFFGSAINNFGVREILREGGTLPVEFTRSEVDYRFFQPVTLQSKVGTRLKYAWGSVNDKNLFELGGIDGLVDIVGMAKYLDAVETLEHRFGPLDLVIVESGGDNLAATFSPELSDLTLYVIDVAEGEKIPRKGGPGIMRSDLLVINKIDLAPYVGASLEVMERDARKMRNGQPFVFTNLMNGEGLQQVISWVKKYTLLEETEEPTLYR